VKKQKKNHVNNGVQLCTLNAKIITTTSVVAYVLKNALLVLQIKDFIVQSQALMVEEQVIHGNLEMDLP
jgi:hypothetical protein